MSSDRYAGEMTTTPTPWLTAEEEHAWRALWAVMTWLPARLDAQLRAEAGLSLAEYSALSQISEAPGRAVRLSDLARSANMTLSHLSRVIARLEGSGWVERLPDPADGRFTLGRLTQAGWETVQRAAPGHVRAVRRLVVDALEPAQLRALGDAASVVATLVDPLRGRAGGAGPEAGPGGVG